jgi:hypothetical protein
MGKPLKKCGDTNCGKAWRKVFVATKLSENRADAGSYCCSWVVRQGQKAGIVCWSNREERLDCPLAALFALTCQVPKELLSFFAHLRILSPRTIGPVN